MITFALSLCFTAAILYAMRLPRGMAGNAGVFSKSKEPSIDAQSVEFREFCDSNCRYRYICCFKKSGRRNSTCYEYELSKHALW